MSDDFLAFFRHEPSRRLAAGETLFNKGDPADAIHVVRSGELQIIDGNRVFETLGPGGIVGEMALIDGGPRSATVRASAPSEVVALDQKRFLFMVQQTPFFALRVLKVMSSRIRAMNADVTTVDEVGA